MSAEKTKFKKIFYMLGDRKQLPDYKLERRADMFFAIHLEDRLKNTYRIMCLQAMNYTSIQGFSRCSVLSGIVNLEYFRNWKLIFWELLSI